jgi:hypothetical protein
MAKAPSATEERFRIHAESSKDEMGHILAELTKLGLQNIGYELITDVITFRKNGARKVYDVTGTEFARAFLKENASFAAIQLVNHFKANDRTNGLAYKAIRDLVGTGELKKLGPGNYQRAGVKALPAPKYKRPAPHVGPRQEVGNKEIVLSLIKGRAKFTVKDLQNQFSKKGRNPKSVSPIITKLAQAGIIRMLEPGTYAWGKVKKKKVTKKTPAAVKKTRGAIVAQASLTERTDG